MSLNMKIVFINILITVFCFTVYSQINQDNYIDIGKNNVSEGAFLKLALISSYEIKNYKAQTGILWSFSNQSDKTFTGWFLNASGNFKIKKVPFEACLFYRHNPFSKIMHENNWGILLGYNSNHFRLKIGNNFRSYKLNKSAIKEYGIQNDGSKKILEPRNLMYSFAYYLKPVDHKWNTAASITNYDYFLIQQETNPIIICRFLYNIKPGLNLYSDLWYQSAGLFNMRVNYFGFFFRTGISWQINI
jgi:hypothetical protein